MSLLQQRAEGRRASSQFPCGHGNAPDRPTDCSKYYTSPPVQRPLSPIAWECKRHCNPTCRSARSAVVLLPSYRKLSPLREKEGKKEIIEQNGKECACVYGHAEDHHSSCSTMASPGAANEETRNAIHGPGEGRPDHGEMYPATRWTPAWFHHAD